MAKVIPIREEMFEGFSRAELKELCLERLDVVEGVWVGEDELAEVWDSDGQMPVAVGFLGDGSLVFGAIVGCEEA